jgi:hypothetical protein
MLYNIFRKMFQNYRCNISDKMLFQKISINFFKHTSEKC